MTKRFHAGINIAGTIDTSNRTSETGADKTFLQTVDNLFGTKATAVSFSAWMATTSFSGSSSKDSKDSECKPGTWTPNYGGCRDYKLGVSLSGGVKLKGILEAKAGLKLPEFVMKMIEGRKRLEAEEAGQTAANEGETASGGGAGDGKQSQGIQFKLGLPLFEVAFINPELTFHRTAGVTGYETSTEGKISLLDGLIEQRFGFGTMILIRTDHVQISHIFPGAEQLTHDWDLIRNHFSWVDQQKGMRKNRQIMLTSRPWSRR